MKKLLILLAIVLSGCSTCLMSQIPPQYLQVGEGCGAALPNYLTSIQVTGNCNITSVEQTPSPGSWLTVPTTTVLIRAKYNTDDYVDMMFTVTLFDLRTPVFVLTDTTLITGLYEQIDAIYNIADRILATTDLWADGQRTDTIPVWEDYYNNTLISWTDPGNALRVRV